MTSLNKVLLIGNVGADPEIKITQQGTRYGRLTLATSDYWKDKTTGERKSSTVWHSIKIFDSLVGICQNYVHKGSKICVEGSIRTYEFDKNGETCKGTEILAKNITLLDKANTQETPTAAQYSKQAKEEFFGNEIPF